MSGTVTLIVYGTLLAGECNHFYCREALEIVSCTVYGTLYDTGLGYPAFVPGGNEPVAAEAVTIPEYCWQSIDELEDYPREYDRRLIEAELPSGETLAGWIYIMNVLPSGSVVIKSGDWRKR